MKQYLEKIIYSLIGKKFLNRNLLSAIKRQFAASFGIPVPTNAELLQAYHILVKKNKIRKNPLLERLLKKREIRTLSGVAPIAVLTKPYPCPGECIYCPNELNMPKSYLSNEPAVMRAILNKFDPFKQVRMRLRALEANGHPIDKCELIVMGGTWSYLPHRYQTWFIKRCFEAFNTNSYKLTTNGYKLRIRDPWLSVKNPWQSVLKNNKCAKHRVVGLTLETRPDYINPKEILRMRQLGCTRVEIGVQSIYDDILKLNKRGCTREQIITATRLLKDAGFKVTYHLMPDLPGSSVRRDLTMCKELFTNPCFQPDQIKIYPCVVTRGAKIFKWFKSKKYKPYTEKQLFNLLINIKKIIPPYVRLTRLIRDIPSESIIAGNKISNLRQLIQQKMKLQGVKCQCIRCREIQGSDYKIKDVKLIKREYDASEAKEIFLSYEDTKQNKLIAFLRLRLPDLPQIHKKPQNSKSSQNSNLNSNKLASKLECYLPVLHNSALVRELHTYGTMLPIGESGYVKPGQMTGQHRGFGKKLLAEAEKLTQKANYPKIAVIAGIGVRNYYRKLGYKLQDEYMVKDLTKIKT